MTRSAIALLACAASGWAAQSEYFPLQVGNRWVLESTSFERELLTIEVLRSRARNGETWFLVSGYAPGQRWMRQSADGTLLALDEAAGKEETLARVSVDASTYRTKLSGCDQTATPVSLSAPYRGPNLEAERPLAIQYGAESCRDVGLRHEAYAPGIGLVRRSIITIRGESTFDFVYARVNGAAVLGKSKEIVIPYDFNNGSSGWLASFADYSLQTSDLRMFAEPRPLPDEIGSARNGFFLQSMNRSDDLFMFLKKQVATEDGLEANQAYRVSFDIRFASNAPTGCFGVGGSPGDSVYLKAGASADEPVAAIAGGSDIRLLIDKGQQSVGGRDAGLVGTVANGRACVGNSHPYVTVRKEYAHAFPIRTDGRASFWLITGTDSGYEGLTGLYYESITVRINPWVEPASRP
jgi:hypothetical protein